MRRLYVDYILTPSVPHTFAMWGIRPPSYGGAAHAQGSHSFYTANTHHTCLYLVSVHQTAPPLTIAGLIAAMIAAYTHLSTPRRWKAELAQLVTYSGRFTHRDSCKSGHLFLNGFGFGQRPTRVSDFSQTKTGEQTTACIEEQEHSCQEA